MLDVRYGSQQVLERKKKKIKKKRPIRRKKEACTRTERIRESKEKDGGKCCRYDELANVFDTFSKLLQILKKLRRKLKCLTGNARKVDTILFPIVLLARLKKSF